MDRNAFLQNEAGRRLYQFAKTLPIIDYHCHLSPREIWEDRPFENPTQLWLSGDHYKWRLMRAFGIDESLITGDAGDFEKFQKYAECISLAAGNPLFHWTAMEMGMYFCIEEPLNGDNAADIWNRASAVIRSQGLSPRKLIQNSNVRYIATTDDPADSLEYHQKLAEDESFPVRVAPSFRTDNLLSLRKPGYPEYIGRLSKASRVEIRDIAGLEQAVQVRLDDFVRCGCSFSDVGIPWFPLAGCSREEADGIFRRALHGEEISQEEHRRFLGYFMAFLAGEYRARRIVMQMHLAVVRNANSVLFEALGPDCGGDCVGDCIPQEELVAFLDQVNRTSGLPHTILYTLNPSMYPTLATAAGSFPNVYLGAAWWFNDHKCGIEEQLRVCAQTSHLAVFPGMLTDSRSFLSYARHDYFRRIFCNLLGQWLEAGEFSDEAAAKTLVRRVCYENSLAMTQGGIL